MQNKQPSIFLFAALFGLGVSLTIHIISYFSPQSIGNFSFSYVLHFFALLMVIPAIGALDRINQTDNWRLMWKSLQQKVPKMLQWLAVALLAYALFNFFYNFMVLNQGGQVCIAEGEYVLSGKEGILKKLSTEEYFVHKAYSTRTDSAYWILFFYLQSVILYTGLQMYNKG
ncbi:MAG: hypothetical protein R3E32_21020 [Chitinophagales bacterium]